MRLVCTVVLNVSVDNNDGRTERKMVLWRVYATANSKTHTELHEMSPQNTHRAS